MKYKSKFVLYIDRYNPLYDDHTFKTGSNYSSFLYVTFRKLLDKKSKSFAQTVHVVDSSDYQGDDDAFISCKRRSHANIKYIVIANIVPSIQFSGACAFKASGVCVEHKRVNEPFRTTERIYKQ